MKWSHIKKVSPNDLDLNYIASPSAYLRYMQEAAHMHMLACPPTPDELKAESKVFVLSRVSMSVRRPLHACDTIRVSTWACAGHGATFPRCAEVSVLCPGKEENRQNGYSGPAGGIDCAEGAGKMNPAEDAAEGEWVTAAVLSSEWALLNTSDHTLCRASDYPHDFSPEAAVQPDLPVRFRMPKDAVFEYVGDYTAVYGDVDLNRHVNNARYPDIFCGYLPSMDGLAVKNMTISYIHEIPLGHTVKIYVSSLEGGFGVRSVLEDGSISAEAYIATVPVSELDIRA